MIHKEKGTHMKRSNMTAEQIDKANAATRAWYWRNRDEILIKGREAYQRRKQAKANNESQHNR